MGVFRFLAVVISLCAVTDGATPREVFSNSTVFLSFSVGGMSSSGSGFILFRPNDPSKANDPKGTEGTTFLVTNKHVLPPEGKECALSMRVTTGTQASPTVLTIDVPTVGPDGKYLPSVHLHPKNDVAVIAVTPEVVQHKMRPDFVFTTLLGTKDKLGAGGVGLAGDEIYILGYPAGIFDTTNANPIWRIGIVSSNPLLGYSFPDVLQTQWHLPAHVDGFLIDAQVYPGSSGSMVVNDPASKSFDAPGAVMAGGPRSIPYVLGILSDSIPIFDTNLRLVSRMGLGIVQSADAISETIESFFTKK